MFNPLVDDFKKLSDAEVEEKISELGRKYWMTQNPQVQQQIATILEMYRQEAQTRRAIQYQKSQDDDDNDLDSLININ